MAIVRTTPRDENDGAESGEDVTETATSAVPVSRDRTRSVVAQQSQTGGVAVQRPRRTPGQITQRPNAATQPQSGDLVRDTVAEVKRVEFPSREERISGTVVTLGLLVFFALFLWGMEALISNLFMALGILPANFKELLGR